MSRRYVASADASYVKASDCRTIRLGSFDVLEPEPLVRATGLLDASGSPILVEERMDPIGFVRFGGEA